VLANSEVGAAIPLFRSLAGAVLKGVRWTNVAVHHDGSCECAAFLEYAPLESMAPVACDSSGSVLAL
jgi:hypothetical protein